MQPLRLKFSALKTDRPFRLRRSGALLDDVTSAPDTVRLSRRQLLGLSVSGAAAISAVMPSMKALGATMLGDFDIVGDKDRVALTLGGKERWVIDTARFVGRPSIDVRKGKEGIQVTLKGARYPGTELPADLHCEIRPGLFGRRMKITMPLGGFTASVPLEQWLAGMSPARSVVTLDAKLCALGNGSGAMLRGTASAEFAPDWTLRLDGKEITRLHGLGGDIVSDAFLLALLSPDDESFIEDAPSKRSLIMMERGSREWPLAPVVARGSAWKLDARGSAFDILHIEAGEEQAGSARRALLAEGSGESSHLAVRPCAALLNPLGDQFQLPLREPRYAIAFDPTGERTALTARFGADPVWLHTTTGSALIGDGEGAGRFEIEGANGVVDRVECAPAMHSTFAPLIASNFIAQPAKAEPGSLLAFRHASHDDEPLAKYAAELRFTLDDERKTALIQKNIKVSVVRPEDLLVLDFEFVNMSLSKNTRGRGGYQLVPGANARIVMKFQPQNIAEQAFFEKDENIPVDIPKNSDGSAHEPADPDKSKGSSENPVPPPVQSRASGPSRLVFKVPSGVASIDYSLEEILERCREYELSVAATALPPKQPLEYFIVPGITGGTKLSAKTIFKMGSVTEVRAQKSVISTTPSKGITKDNVAKGIGKDNVSKSPSNTSVSSKVSVGKGIVVASAPKAEEFILEKRANELARRSDLARYIEATEINPGLLGGIVDLKPDLKKPTNTETAIESPFRLILSPHVHSAWAYSLKPVISQRTGRSELWHARLAVRKPGALPDEANEGLRTVRAIWARSNPPYDPSNPASSDPNNPESFDPADSPGWPKHGNVPFRMSLDGFDRHNIVHLTSNYGLHLEGRKPYDPVPISVKRLMLSSLGAWMDTRGAWDKLPSGLAVEEWRHRGTMGRDHYVRVVYAGFLFPFGHRASLIKVTERKFQPHPTNASVKVAYLRQRMFIVVREPQKLTGATGLKSEADVSYDLSMPFKNVRITTLVTPNLDPPENSDYPDGYNQSTFWPKVGGKDFLFHLVMEDLDGNTSEITAPLQFVGKEINDMTSRSVLANIASNYESASGTEAQERRERPFNGQRVAFAPTKKPGDTQFETDAVTFGAEVPDQTTYTKIGAMGPRFFPVVRKSKLRIPAIKHLANNNSQTEVKFNAEYLKGGFTGGSNAGEVFLEMIGGAVPLSFEGKGDRSGGLAKPNMSITALSRSMGPVAGTVDTIRQGTFDPEEFFQALGAKLFGCIDLWDIVQAVGLGEGMDLVPRFVTEALSTVEAFMKDVEAFKSAMDVMPSALSSAASTIKSDIDKILIDITSFNATALATDLNTFVGHISSMSTSIPTVQGMDAALRNDVLNRLAQFQSTLSDVNEFVQKVKSFVDAIEMAKEMKVKFEWRPRIGPWGIDAAHPLFIPHNDRGFFVMAELRAKTDGKSEPSASVSCGLENFTLDLLAPLSFIKLHFDRLEFFAGTGKKADVNVEFGGLEFVGVLSFIETLKDLIPLDGFSDPPALDISENGISASFSLPLPNIAVGIFSMQNLSLGAGFTIPFIGEPLSVNFNFCTRENPFLLTVSLFGGGGFFGITLTPAGVHILEASFEFGACVALDFGVASGSISVMAGIYFKLVMEGGKDNASLTGFFRIHGEVDVLGLISASITLELSLTYEFSSGKCVGRATLTIEVEVLFFSASVEIECERKFAGSKGDPSFEQLMAAYEDPDGNIVRPWEEYCGAFAA